MKKQSTDESAILSPILNNLNVAVFRTVSDSNGGFIDVNPAFLDMFGYASKEELAPLKVADLYANPEDRDRVRDELHKNGFIRGVELICKRKSGELFPAQVSSVLVKDSQGAEEYFDGVIEDVSRLHNTISALEKKKQELEAEQKLFYSGPVIHIHWPIKGDEPLLYISKNVREILGYEPDEFLSGKILYPKLVHPEDLPGLVAQIDEIVHTDEDVMYVQPYRIRKQDGDYIWVQDYAYVIRDEQGVIQSIMGYIYDVTKAHQFQQRLAESELRYRGLVENSPTGILRIDLEGKILDVNPQMVSILGSPSAEATKSFNMFEFPPLQKAGIAGHFRTAIQTQQTVKFTGEYKTAWGKVIHYQSVINPVLNAEGAVIGAQANMEDVTLAFQAEEAKRRIERLQLEERNIFVAAPIMIIKWQISGHKPLEYVSENVESILGYSVADLLEGKVIYSDIIHPQDYERVTSTARSMLESGEDIWTTAPYRIRKSDGDYIWVNDHSTLVRDESGNARNITGIIYDITKHVAAEEMIKSTEITYREIFNATSDAIFIYDANTFRVVDVNSSMLRLYECSYEDAMSSDPGTFSADDADPEQALKYWELAKQGTPQTFEWHAKTILGKPFWVEVSLKKATIHGDERIMVTLRDVTERKAMEDDLRNSLREQEVLTREVHHRVKNNMQVINSILNLQATHTKDPVLTEIFNETQSRIRSMALIHEKLFRSKSMAKVEFAIYLRSLTSEVINFYANTANRVKLIEDIEDVSMDISQAIPCGLIINELLTNALKYAFPNNREGSITVKLSRRGNRSMIEVHDNGVGFPHDFDFELTDTMGLRIVRILTEQLKGEMQIESDSGAHFILSFDLLG